MMGTNGRSEGGRIDGARACARATIVGSCGGSLRGAGCGRGRARPLVLLAALSLLITLLGPATNALGAEGAEPRGAISGEVFDASSHAALQGIEVCAISTNFELFNEEEAGHHFGCAETGADGEYTLSELDPEGYFVEFLVPEESNLNYIAQYYDGKLLPSEASSVPVAAEKTTRGIDAELSPGAEIAGTVTDASTGAPIEKAVACAVETSAEGPFECAFSEAGGEYTIRGLPTGQYKLLFVARGLEVQYYNGKSSAAEAQSVWVTAPALTNGIDAAMTPGSPSSMLPGSMPTESPLSSKLPGGLTTSSSPSPIATVSLAGRRITVARNDHALVKVDCAGATSCRAKLTLQVERPVRVRGKRTLRTVTIGTSAILSIGAGRKATAKITLDSAGRGLLSAADGRLEVDLALVTPGHDQEERVVLVEQKVRSRR